MGIKKTLEKYKCESIKAVYPPKYKCCGMYFHTLENLARHIKYAHPDIYEKEFKQVIDSYQKKEKEKEKEAKTKNRQPRVRKEYYRGGVFKCSKCHKLHSEGWILHYDEEHGGDKLVCCSCKYNMFKPYMRVISVPMGGKVK